MNQLPTQEATLLEAAMRDLHSTVAGAKADVTRIPEHLFVEWYLPYFAGQLETDIENQRALASWMQLAKNQFGEVLVFDAATGRDLFRVPAMASTKQFNPLGNDGVSKLKDIIAFAAQKNHISPTQAKDYLERSLLKKFESMVEKPHVLQDVENTWRSIFAMYDVPIKTVVDGKVVEVGAAATGPANTNPGGFGDNELIW